MRILFGLCTCTPQELQHVCRSSGAACDGPFAPSFCALSTSSMGPTEITFPNYIFVFGHAYRNNTEGSVESTPSVPGELLEETRQRLDWIQASDMPQWWSKECLVQELEKRPDAGYLPLPSLGRVHMKELKEGAFRRFWIPGMHQTVIWIGHGRPSQNSQWERPGRH